MSASVSVVIPFYDGAQTIQRAVDSLANQTVRPKEVVIVDDCSPVPVPEIRSELPVRVERLARNRGIAGARNQGIRVASGDWVGFLDQDDEWHPRKLEWQLPVAERGGADVVVFGRLLHTGQGVRPWLWPPDAAIAPLEAGGDDAMRALVRWGNAAPFVTLLMRRTLFERHGFLDEQLRGGGDDYHFIMRHVAAGLPLRFDGAPAGEHSAIHYFTGRNYSAHAPRWLADNITLVESLAAEYPLVARHRQDALAQAHYTYGRHYDGADDASRAREHYREAASLRPGWMKPRLAALWLALPRPLRGGVERMRNRLQR